MQELEIQEEKTVGQLIEELNLASNPGPFRLASIQKRRVLPHNKKSKNISFMKY
jgi:hypothetical protein